MINSYYFLAATTTSEEWWFSPTPPQFYSGSETGDSYWDPGDYSGSNFAVYRRIVTRDQDGGYISHEVSSSETTPYYETDVAYITITDPGFGQWEVYISGPGDFKIFSSGIGSKHIEYFLYVVGGEYLQYTVEYIDPNGAPPQPPPVLTQVSASSQNFNVTNTQNATVNTLDISVSLIVDQSIKFGTCNLPSASATGDTYIRLIAPDGTEVQANDDYENLASYIEYAVPISGDYIMTIGAYGGESAEGTVAWEIWQ